MTLNDLMAFKKSGDYQKLSTEVKNRIESQILHYT